MSKTLLLRGPLYFIDIQAAAGLKVLNLLPSMTQYIQSSWGFGPLPEDAGCCICVTHQTQEQLQSRMIEGEFGVIETYVRITRALP